jgi:lipoprotein-anchoring transpeptidase ErfK/SrfK
MIMLDHRVLAIAAVLVSIAPAAHAQSYCEQYPWAWQCRNPWARPVQPPQVYREYRYPYQYQRPQPAEPERRYYYGTRPPSRGDEGVQSRSRTPLDPASERQYAALYAGVDDGEFQVPAVKLSQVDPAFLRKTVDYPTHEPPGTIIIDPQSRYLYLIEGGGKAIRYGVGVGRQGFGWSGTASIHDKQHWPDWYPPKEMLARQPELMRHMSELRSGIGMPGGLSNPLGARALYLWQGNKDTLYRIHGTNEPWTIGRSVSSGCIRMLNQDVMDLYERVPVGAKVIVLGSRRAFS